ncbi:MAG: FG-GAP-like repeat-containing protein [Candidatus Hodarchaeota archaeon]
MLIKSGLKQFRKVKRGGNEVLAAVLIIALVIAGTAVGVFVILPMVTRAQQEAQIRLIQDKAKDLTDAIDTLMIEEAGAQQHVSTTVTTPIYYNDGNNVVINFYNYTGETYIPLNELQVALQLGRITMELPAFFTENIPEGGTFYLNGPDRTTLRPVAFYWDASGQTSAYVGLDSSRVVRPLNQNEYSLNMDYRVRVQPGDVVNETRVTTIDLDEVETYGAPTIVPGGHLIVGTANGTLYWFGKQTNSTYSDGIKISTDKTHLNARPCSVDWNGDGVDDLLIGDYTGYITYYQNTNTNNDPNFVDRGYLQDWTTGSSTDLRIFNYGYSSPAAADIDLDGDLDLLVGCGGSNDKEAKRIYYFENKPEGGNPEPKLFRDPEDNYILTQNGNNPNSATSFESREGNSTIAVYQFEDSEGQTDNWDLVVGDAKGDVYLLFNLDTTKDGRRVFEGCPAYPNNGNLGIAYQIMQDYDNTVPVFTDVDDDGNPDLIFGTENGSIVILEDLEDIHDPSPGGGGGGDQTPISLDLEVQLVEESLNKNVEIIIETVILRTKDGSTVVTSTDLLIELSTLEIDEYQFIGGGERVISTLAIKVSINSSEEELLSSYKATANIANLTVRVIKRIIMVS